MKIIITGCGIVGTALAERLSADEHDVTVIDIKDANLNYIRNTLDVMCVTGDCKSPDVLREANVSASDLLIAVTSSDAQNLLCCMVAKKMGVRNTIARIRDTQNTSIADLLKDELGLSMAINPEMDAAHEIFNTLKYKNVGQLESLAKGTTDIITCSVLPGSPLCEVAIRDIPRKLGNVKILICGIKRAEEIFVPMAETVLKANDVLSFIATPRDTVQFFKKMHYDIGRINNLAILGGSKLGRFLALLALENGVPVKIIDRDMAVCRKIYSEVPEAKIVCGDATDTDLLEEEEVLKYEAVVSATEDDATNTMISMYVSANAPNCKVVTKIKKSDFEDMLFNLNIGSVVNPKYITVDHIIRYVDAMQNSLEDEVESICHVIDNRVEVLEFNLHEGMPHLGQQLKDIKFKSDLLIATIYRDGKTFIPGGLDIMQAGDIVVVATTQEGISRFAEVFAE